MLAVVETTIMHNSTNFGIASNAYSKVTAGSPNIKKKEKKSQCFNKCGILNANIEITPNQGSSAKQICGKTQISTKGEG